MEDGKLLSGQDYSTSALVSLRQTCADSGAVVKAQTPSGGDAIFRAGVESAASAAMEPGQGASLGGTSPQRFVSGLANDLGKAVPPESSCSLPAFYMTLHHLCCNCLCSYLQHCHDQHSHYQQVAKQEISLPAVAVSTCCLALEGSHVMVSVMMLSVMSRQ